MAIALTDRLHRHISLALEPITLLTPFGIRQANPV